ncbi:MAG: trigger factor [Bacteroidaceae bacterium]|nr:trigger factor [Bacteroidaceae bacterium]
MTVTKEFTKLEKSAAKLTVTIAKKDVAANYNETIQKYAKNTQLPGFRKGHVPVSVLERKYGNDLKNEIAAVIIDKALNELFKDTKDESIERPLPYAQPVLEDMPLLDTKKDFTFTVTYDVFPKVEVKNFDGVVVKEPQVEIGAKELEDELKAVQERNAVVLDRKDDDAAEKGNIVTVTYFELDDAGKEVEGSKREGYVFTLGENQNIYKFDDDVIGMKKNETKLITKSYAADDKNEELAGKTKKFSLTVTAIKIRNLPALDDDLAQDVSDKFKTLDDLKNDIKKNMETAKTRKVDEIKNNSLLRQLVEKNPFELPESMVKAELDARWGMMAKQFQTTVDQLDKMVAASGQKKEDMLKQWTGDAEEMLKSRIIVDALLREYNIKVTPEEVEAEYTKIADGTGMSVEEVKKHYEDPRAKEYLVDDTKENKLFAKLYSEKVKLEKGDKVAFADLFKDAQ